MNGWRALVGAFVAANFIFLLWGFFGGSGPTRAVQAPGLRAEWVEVEKPWLPAVGVATLPAQPAPKINLKQEQAKLDSAIETASKQVQVDPKRNQQCRLWGPLLQSETSRVEESLRNWPGSIERVNKQPPIGYVVYLPQEVVSSGVGIEQLSGLGIADMFYITTPGPLQGTISLGLFRDLSRARLQKDKLIGQGVAGVQIRDRLGPVRVFFELKGTQTQIDGLASIFNLNRKGQLALCDS